VGIGEVTANLSLDDMRVVNMFKQCGEWQMPVLFHCTGPGRGVYGLYDEIGLPHLSYLWKLLGEKLISKEIFDKITGINALKILKLYKL